MTVLLRELSYYYYRIEFVKEMTGDKECCDKKECKCEKCGEECKTHECHGKECKCPESHCQEKKECCECKKE